MQSLLKIIFGVLLCAFGANILAAPSLEDYGKLPTVGGMRISPNGELVAFRKTLSDKNDRILVYKIDGRKPVYQLDVASIDPQNFYFLTDELIAIFVSRFADLSGYKHAFNVHTIYSLNIKTGKLVQLVQPGRDLSGAVWNDPSRRKSISVGGARRILSLSLDKKEAYIPAYILSSDTDNNPDYSLLRINLGGKGKPAIADKGRPNIIDYFLATDGSILAREERNHLTNKHTIFSYIDDDLKKIYEYESDIASHHFVGLTRDFKSLVFLATTKGENTDSYFLLDLKSGNVTELPYQHETHEIEGVIKNENRVVEGLIYSALTPSYKLFDEKLDSRISKIVSSFPGHSVWLSDWSKDWKDIIVKVSGSNYAGQYFLFSEGKPAEALVSSYSNIKAPDINPIATVNFKARDGLVIPTLLTLPVAKQNQWKNLPAVILPHGGPATHDTIGFDFMAQALASRGYLVVQPQYRGSDGFGYKHQKAGYGEWGKKMQDDLTDAVGFLAKKGYLDPGRVCIVGSSYGGYAALAGAAFTPEIYKCAYSLAGVSHLPKFLAYEKSRYGRASSALAYWKMQFDDGDENLEKEELRSASPYYSADKVKIPIMLVHGKDDQVVKYEQSKLMYSVLKKAGADVKLIELKKEDHHLQEGSTRLQFLETMVDFVEKHLGKAL